TAALISLRCLLRLCVQVSILVVFLLRSPRPPRYTLFPYTTLFRSSFYKEKTIGKAESTVRKYKNSLNVLREALANHRLYYFYTRSEEHTSELQSRFDLVCRLLLEKKKQRSTSLPSYMTHTGRSCSV